MAGERAALRYCLEDRGSVVSIIWAPSTCGGGGGGGEEEEEEEEANVSQDLQHEQ